MFYRQDLLEAQEEDDVLGEGEDEVRYEEEGDQLGQENEEAKEIDREDNPAQNVDNRNADEEAIEEAMQEERNRSTKYSRHPYHNTMGKIANVHVMQIDIKVGEEAYPDQDNEAFERKRRSIILLNLERVVHGGQFYSPSEQAVFAKKGEKKLHQSISNLGGVTEDYLSNPTEKKMKHFLYLVSGCRNMLMGYLDHHEAICGGGRTVRFEYSIASNYPKHHPLEIDLDTIPIDMANNSNPFTSLRIAQKEDVTDDIKDLNQRTLEPLVKLSKMTSIETIQSISPELKTMYVFLAEITQLRANSTDPGIFGIHRLLLKRGQIPDYERVSLPQGIIKQISDEEILNSELPFGLHPSALPTVPRFDNSYDVLQGEDPNPGFFLQSVLLKTKNMHNPYKYTLMLKKLKMMICKQCHDVVPGTIVPGVMQTTDYGKWILKDEVEKKIQFDNLLSGILNFIMMSSIIY